MHVILYGPRHIGKSTIVKNVIRQLNLQRSIRLGGFITYAGRGKDLNIYMSPAEGVRKYDVDNCVAKRTSDYAYPFPKIFDTLGVSILEKCKPISDLICMDELGFLEGEAFVFQNAVLRCLDETVPVLGVVKDEPVPWLELIKKHPQAELIAISPKNRDYIVPHILNILEASINKRYSML